MYLPPRTWWFNTIYLTTSPQQCMRLTESGSLRSCNHARTSIEYDGGRGEATGSHFRFCYGTFLMFTYLWMICESVRDSLGVWLDPSYDRKGVLRFAFREIGDSSPDKMLLDSSREKPHVHSASCRQRSGACRAPSLPQPYQIRSGESIVDT